MNEGYNGWANWETWNVALWIGNDEGIYDTARMMRRYKNPYEMFANAMCGVGFKKTPDGASYKDKALDIEALNEMIREL